MAEFALIIGVDSSDPGLQAIKDGDSLNVRQAGSGAEGKTAISAGQKGRFREGELTLNI